MKEAVAQVMHGVIVSCQAYEGTPLYGSDNMAKMAACAKIGGAAGIRGCWQQDIRAIKRATDLPVIGINKIFSDEDPVDAIFITPTFSAAREIIDAGCDILGIDCTLRPHRGLDQLRSLLSEIHYSYPDLPILADLASAQEACLVAATGYVDIVSTTLAGYTRSSENENVQGPDINALREIKASVSLPVNAEGRIWELADLQQVLEAGADMVTIGSAITRPQLISERFVACNRRTREGAHTKV